MSQYDCAPDEASPTIRRLLEARSARSRTALADMQQALELATHAFDDALAAANADDADAEVTALVDRLTAAAAADLDRANTQIEIATADNARLGAALDDAREQLQQRERMQQAAERELAASMARIEELENVETEVAALSITVEATQQELLARQQEHAALASELAASVARIRELEKAEAEAAALTTTLAATRQLLADREDEQATLAGELAASAARVAELEKIEAETAALAITLEETQQLLVLHEQEQAALVSRLETSAARIESLENDVADHTATVASLGDVRRQLAASEQQQERLTMDLAASAEQIRLLEATGAEQAGLSAALTELRQQLHASEDQRTLLANDLATATAEVAQLEAVITEHSSISAALEYAQQQLESSEAQRETLAGDLATFGARIRTLEDATGNRVFVDHLPAIFRSVSGARTIPDALTAVANGLTCYFSRVAIFRVRANRLEAVYQDGFDFAGDLSSVFIPLTAESPLAEAVSAERVRVLAAADLAGATIPFGGTPGCALALPIAIEHKTVAVVYADDATRLETEIDTEERGAFAQLVRDYVTAHIDRIVSSQRTLAELDAYARMLLDEVAGLHETDLGAGRPAAQLQARLRENLRTARQIYAQRIELEPAAAATLLEDRIAALTRETPASPFSRDLLEAIASENSNRKAAAPAAQAS
jgi:hypothetical protein